MPTHSRRTRCRRCCRLRERLDRQQEINAYGFNAHAGLRESELMGLAWEDVDTETLSVRIWRAPRARRVQGAQDTGQHLGEFQLQPDAIYWLQRQQQYTEALPPVEATVRQKNERRPCHRAPALRLPQHQHRRCSARDTVFRKVFQKKQAGVRVRGANQPRHAFASRPLTHAVPLEWIAPIMGTSIAMLRKHYAKVIVSDRPNFAALITALLKGKQAEQIAKARERDGSN